MKKIKIRTANLKHFWGNIKKLPYRLTVNVVTVFCVWNQSFAFVAKFRQIALPFNMLKGIHLILSRGSDQQINKLPEFAIWLVKQAICLRLISSFE